MVVQALKLLVLRTSRLDESRRFYQALGINFAEERHGTGPLHYAGRAGETVLELYPLPGDSAVVDSSLRLGFSVTGLAQTVLSLEAAGAAVIHKPRATPWGIQAVVRGPDDRAVELYEA